MKKLKGVSFRVSALQLPHYATFTEENNRTVFSPGGFLSNIFLLLQEKLKFSYEIAEKQAYGGKKLTNGTWIGQVALLQRKEVDIAVAFEINSEKLEVIDMTDPFIFTDVKFFTRAPKEITKIFAPIYPFTLSVWLSALTAFFFTGVALYLLFYITKKSNEKTPSVFDIFWALFGSFTNKENRIFNPVEQSRRWTVYGWTLAMFVLMASYSGALLSFISFPGKEAVPRNFQQLITALQDGRYAASASLNTDIEEIIRAAKSSTTCSLNELLENGKLINHSIDNYRSLLLKRNNGFITHNIVGQLMIYEYGKELFLESEDSLYTSFSGLGLTKNFPYKRSFNQMLRRIIEAGFVDKFVNKELDLITMKRKVIGQDPDSIRPLSLDDVMGPFCILFLGYCLSLVTFIFEFSIHKYLTNSKGRNTR